MSILYQRGAGRYPRFIFIDNFEYESEMEYFCRWMLKKQLSRPLEYLEVFKMDDMVIEQIMREKDKEINEFRNALGFIPPVERKRQLMRLEKEHLVDMVFNLESRNETLVNNLIKVENMYRDFIACTMMDSIRKDNE